MTREFGTKNQNTQSVLIVSTYPPDRDGIAYYTQRLVKSFEDEKITINLAKNNQDWKRNSIIFGLSIVKKAIKSLSAIVHIQFSYFMFGNELVSGLFPLMIIGLKIARKKIVITIHDIIEKSKITDDTINKYSKSVFPFLNKIAIEYYTRTVCLLADKIIVHSEIAKKTLRQDYEVPSKKIKIIPHGIDQKPSIEKNNNKFLIRLQKKNFKIITFFGFVRKGKGLEDLIDSWKRIDKKVKLLIVGGKHPTKDENYYQQIRQLIKDSNLENQILLCGYVPEEMLPNYFNVSNAFIFPYNGWGEVIASSGALSVVAPYMKPIIATDVPAFEELKKNNSAIIIKKGDSEALSESIKLILTDNELRKSIVSNFRDWAYKSNWSSIAKKTMSIYKEIQ